MIALRKVVNRYLAETTAAAAASAAAKPVWFFTPGL
jgi:hypothetical protein